MTITDTDVSSRLHVEAWGEGTPVVLVHSSLALGAEEWEAQRPLAEAGFRLLVPDRRGYGRSPEADGEDFLRDAEDIADAICDDLAERIGARRAVVRGAGHEIQFTGEPINEVLLRTWRAST